MNLPVPRRILAELHINNPGKEGVYLCLVRRSNTLARDENERFTWEMVSWIRLSFNDIPQWSPKSGRDYGNTVGVIGWVDLPDPCLVAQGRG